MSYKSLLTVDARTKRRNAAETRFKAYGLAAIVAAILALAVLLTSVIGTGQTSNEFNHSTYWASFLAVILGRFNWSWMIRRLSAGSRAARRSCLRTSCCGTCTGTTTSCP